MSAKLKGIAVCTIIACIAFFVGFYVSNKNKHINTVANEHQILRTNGVSSFPYLNPFTDCIRSKGLRMDELKSFKTLIDDYINLQTLKHKGLHISYYFRDLNNGMWVGINEKELFSPASLMKVPTLIAVLKAAESKPDILQKAIIYSSKDFVEMDEEAGFQKTDGQAYSINELLEQSINYSDNAATLMLMNFVGMDKVVKVEDDLNLHVADNFTEQTNFVSVKNYAGVFRVLYNSAYLNEEMSEKALELLLNSKFEGGIRSGIPAQIKVAHKYGERDIRYNTGQRETIQLHHFGIVYYPSKPFLLGVMTRGNISKEEKSQMITDLAKITYEAVDKQMSKTNSARNEKFLQSM